MPTARQNPLISALGRKLYVMGGMDHEQSIPLVEIFDVDRNTWTRGNPLPETKFYSGSVVFNGLILVLSGAEAGDRQTSILVYDPRREQWGRATPLPYAIKLTWFAIKGNELYVVGGSDPAFKADLKLPKYQHMGIADVLLPWNIEAVHREIVRDARSPSIAALEAEIKQGRRARVPELEGDPGRRADRPAWRTESAVFFSRPLRSSALRIMVKYPDPPAPEKIVLTNSKK